MTACVNKKHTRRVALAISASLVGALSLGAAAPAFAANGIETMNLTPEQSFENGWLSGATNGTDAIEDLTKDTTFTFATGSGQYLVPTELTTDGGEVVEIDADNRGEDNATLTYFNSNASGDYVSKYTGDLTKMPAGYYYVKIEMTSGDYEGRECRIPFRVIGNQLKDAVAYDKTDGEDNTSDTEFVWNNKDHRDTMGIALDGAALVYGDDYTWGFKVSNDGGKTYQPTGDVTKPGDYMVVVNGKGDYSGQTVSIPFKVEKLDLSKADLSIADQEKAAGYNLVVTDVTVDGGDLILTTDAATEADEFQVSKMQIKVNGNYAGTGDYTATVSAPADATYITGTAEVPFSVVDKVLSDRNVFYGDSQLQDMSIDLTKDFPFDAGKIVVKDGETTLKASQVDITCKDSEGNEVDPSEAANPGVWDISVRVNAAATEWAYGSDTYTVTIKVIGGEVADEDVVFKYDGKVVDDFKVSYDGTDVLDKLETVVTLGDETLVAGEDYEVVVTNKADEEVSEAVDADTYTVTLKSDKYNGIDGQNITITVKPIDITAIKVSDEDLFSYVYNDATYYFIPFTGSVIETPTFVYSSNDVNGKPVVDDEGNAVWKELPAEAFTADYYTYKANASAKKVNVDNIEETGLYTVVFADGEKASNYDISGVTDTVFEVNDVKVYSDVPNNMWYSQYVYTASNLKYMNGFNGTSFFGPEQNITRGDVAVVLFKMAGGTLDADNTYPGSSDDSVDNKGYQTGFSDVDPDVYYAQAIAWAENAGIVTGYDGTDLFMPDANISRQELATMLARYAKLKGDDVSADLSELDAYTDGSAVADFADEAVAWAVESGIMGQDVTELRPADAITRAEVAAMAVRMQPKALENDNLVK